MISNIAKGIKVYGALKYNFEKIEEKTARIFHTNNIVDPSP